MPRMRITAAQGVACLALLTGTTPALAAELLPNLEALPAHDIEVVENFGGVLELRFGATTWNSGEGPLELVAGEVNRDKQNVMQRTYNTDGTYQERLAGSFVWHQGHNHFHFDDYALYTLQPVQGKSKRTSAKTSFCLMDTERVDGSLPGSPNSPVYANCGNFFQGISVGWSDIYGAHLPGQSIELTRLKDGDYRLMVEADPKNRLVETNDDDNTSCVLLNLSITNQTVTILNPNGCDAGSPPPGGEVTVTAIDPNSAAVDEPIPVSITGTGFTDGIAVEFVNGQGSKPQAGDVVVVSDTEIQATVTVKRRGGNKPDNVWDLVVGSGTLPDAFIVLP